MSARMTGISDQVVIFDATPAEVEVGWLQSSGHMVDNQTEARAGISGGANYQFNLDGLANITGNIETNPVTLDLLKLMGTLSAGSITFGNSLPVHIVKMNTESGKYVEITGVKFSPLSIDFTKGEPMKISFDFIGLSTETKTGTLNYTEPTEECLDFPNQKVKIAGSYVGSVETGNIKLDYQTEAKRGIENVAAGEIRKNTEITTKLKKIDFSLTIEITDGVAWTQALGGDTIQDIRTDTTITLESGIADGGNVNLTGVRVKDISADKGADGEIRTAVITGTALGITVSGLAT